LSGFVRTLRKLVLGETWQLPVGVAVAVAAAAALRLGSGGGGWWRHGGGAVLAALLAGALLTAVLGSTKASKPPKSAGSALPEGREDPVNSMNKR
jgi:hypothetical protein